MTYSKRNCLQQIQAIALMSILVVAGSESLAQTRMPDIAFSGFGTLGYAILDDPDAQFRTGVAVDGADDAGSFEVDSRLGLQLDVVFNPEFSGALQLLGREAADGDPAVELELAYIRWQAGDNLAIRVGRMSLPVYSTSDYREVGFAVPYLRPPEDVYSMIPLRGFDGADLTLDHTMADTLLRWQLFAGQSRKKLFDDLEADADRAFGISFIVDRGPARVRISHVDTQVDIDSGNASVAEVRAGIEQALPLVPSLADIAGDFAGERVPLSFDAISLNLDFGRLFIDAQYARRRVESWVSDVDGWSIALGTRLGNLQPYVSVSRLREPDGDRRIELPENPSLDQLEASVNVFYEPRDQSTVSVGARYDLSPNFALKAQVDRLSREQIGISFKRNSTDDGLDTGKDVTLFSVAVDFVF